MNNFLKNGSHKDSSQFLCLQIQQQLVPTGSVQIQQPQTGQIMQPGHVIQQPGIQPQQQVGMQQQITVHQQQPPQQQLLVSLYPLKIKLK